MRWRWSVSARPWLTWTVRTSSDTWRTRPILSLSYWVSLPPSGLSLPFGCPIHPGRLIASSLWSTRVSERTFTAPGLARALRLDLSSVSEVVIGLGGAPRSVRFVEVTIELFQNLLDDEATSDCRMAGGCRVHSRVGTSLGSPAWSRRVLRSVHGDHARRCPPPGSPSSLGVPSRSASEQRSTRQTCASLASDRRPRPRRARSRRCRPGRVQSDCWGKAATRSSDT